LPHTIADAGAHVRRWAAPGLVIHVRSVLRALRERVRERERERVQQQYMAHRASGKEEDLEIANQARAAAAVLRGVLGGGMAPVRDVWASGGKGKEGPGQSGKGGAGQLRSKTHGATGHGASGQDAGALDRRTVQQVGLVQGAARCNYG